MVLKWQLLNGKNCLLDRHVPYLTWTPEHGYLEVIRPLKQLKHISYNKSVNLKDSADTDRMTVTSVLPLLEEHAAVKCNQRQTREGSEGI